MVGDMERGTCRWDCLCAAWPLPPLALRDRSTVRPPLLPASLWLT